MATTYLSRTPASTGNTKIFTKSFWFKRGNIGSNQKIFTVGSSGTEAGIQFFSGTNDDALEIYQYSSSAYQYRLDTNQLLRDTSAWYHLVVSVDTTQATESDRIKIYLNGSQITSFSTSTYPTQNLDLLHNNTSYPFYIGFLSGASAYFDGSMAHVHFIDGTAYDADTFGETDATTGIWKPKTAPSVTYGTNGFFLKFENSGSFGTDSSGNANNFTVNGTMTQTIDTPSNVFATLNPLNKTVASFSNGNLSCTTSTGEFGSASTLGVSQGKYYAEFKVTGSNYLVLGVADENGVIYSSNNNISSGKTGATGSIGFPVFLGVYRINNSNTSYGSSFSQNDIASIAIDCDNQKIYLAKNGTWQNSADPVAGTGGIDASSALTGSDWFFTIGDDTNTLGSSADANFGNGYFGTTAVSSAQNPDDGIGIFEYDVPTGYRALCTKSINAQEYD